MPDDFTLVIPTYNRQGLLLKQLGYYASVLAGFPILIADSSYEWLDGKPCPNFRVVGYPEDTPIHEKLLDVLALVKTPLVVIGADDDFFNVEGLRQCAAFLNEHPDYASCSGQTVTMEPNGAIGHYPQRSIEDREALDRLTSHLSRYTTKWYAMQRTEDVRRHYAKTIAARVDETHLGELLPSCLSVLAGKSKVLDAFYMVRRVWPDRLRPMSKAALTERPSWFREVENFGRALDHEEPFLLLSLWLSGRKRSWVRCAVDNWLANQRWSALVIGELK